ncbi:MAG: DUF5320 family protein [Bacillota bacterium]
MPGFDGTGPLGVGPGTGGGFGPCGTGRIGMWGFRGGCGRGFHRWWQVGPVPYYGLVKLSPEEEKASLKTQVEQLKAGLSEMEKRMAELET